MSLQKLVMKMVGGVFVMTASLIVMMFFSLEVSAATLIGSGLGVTTGAIPTNDANEQTAFVGFSTDGAPIREIRIEVRGPLQNPYFRWINHSGNAHEMATRPGNQYVRLVPERSGLIEVPSLQGFLFRWTMQPGYGNVAENTVWFIARDTAGNSTGWQQISGNYAVEEGASLRSTLLQDVEFSTGELVNDGLVRQKATFSIHKPPTSNDFEYMQVAIKNHAIAELEPAAFRYEPLELGGRGFIERIRAGNQFVDLIEEECTYTAIENGAIVELVWTTTAEASTGNYVTFSWREIDNNYVYSGQSVSTFDIVEPVVIEPAVVEESVVDISATFLQDESSSEATSSNFSTLDLSSGSSELVPVTNFVPEGDGSPAVITEGLILEGSLVPDSLPLNLDPPVVELEPLTPPTVFPVAEDVSSSTTTESVLPSSGEITIGN